MSDFRIRPASAEDADAIVALNREAQAQTSPMDLARFHQLSSLSDRLVVVESASRVEAFLMGFFDRSTYDSPHYRWFDARLKNYFYIDRVVVSEACRGVGVGTALYSEVAQWSSRQHKLWLAAEINVEPPNPGSLEFHRRAGFVPVGTMASGAGKVVSLQILSLPQQR